jgi:hypothetical protein
MVAGNRSTSTGFIWYLSGRGIRHYGKFKRRAFDRRLPMKVNIPIKSEGRNPRPKRNPIIECRGAGQILEYQISIKFVEVYRCEHSDFLTLGLFYQTNPCARRASSKFRVQTSEMGNEAKREPETRNYELHQKTTKRTHWTNPRAEIRQCGNRSPLDVYNDFTKRTHLRTTKTPRAAAFQTNPIPSLRVFVVLLGNLPNEPIARRAVQGSGFKVQRYEITERTQCCLPSISNRKFGDLR